MSKKTFLLAVLLMLVAFGISGAQDSIRIGAIFDLSGPTEDVSRPYAEGVAAYIDFVNSNGGVNGLPIELRAADYGFDVNTAVQIYDQFASEGVVAFLGWGTTDTEELTGSAAGDEIPFISASYSEALNDPNGNAPYNFVVGTTYSDQMEIMLHAMVELWQNNGNSAGDMAVAIFHDDNDFGTDPLQAAVDAANALGIGGLLEVAMPRNARDFTAELQEADDYGVTHIIIQSTPGSAAILTHNIVDFFGGGSIQIGCLSWCADEQFISGAGGAAEGVLGAQPFTPTSVSVNGQDDARSYLSARGQSLDNASLHFTQGWATASLVVEAIQVTLDNGLDLSGPNLRAVLESFDGVGTGGLLPDVTFTPSDHRGTRALTIYAVQNGEWVVVSGEIDLR